MKFLRVAILYFVLTTPAFFLMHSDQPMWMGISALVIAAGAMGWALKRYEDRQIRTSRPTS